jgi:pSer/pThr/pTyr-binding forkhead associated (FHA) protein
MLEVTLLVRTKDEEFEEPLDRSMTIGRSYDAGLYINDEGMSRIHASIFFDGEQVWIVDENSTNGTFVNGQQVFNREVYLKDGDKIKVGDYTTIQVIFHRSDYLQKEEEEESGYVQETPQPQRPKSKVTTQTQQTTTQPANQSQKIFSPMFLAILSSLMVAVIGVVGVIVVFNVRRGGGTTIAQSEKVKGVRDPIINADLTELNLEDAWDVEEKEIAADDEQVVTDADWKTALQQATAPRGSGATGLAAAGSIDIPPELRSKPGFLAIQAGTAIEDGLRIPHDYAELSQFIKEGQYVELKPVGKNNSYVIYAVGGGTSEEGFKHYFIDKGKSVPLFRNASEYQAGINSAENKDLAEQFYKTNQGFVIASQELDMLVHLAQGFNGKNFDLTSGQQRKFFRRKMLTMLRPTTLAFLEELGSIYHAKFNRPLAVSSLVRTLEYQTELSKRNKAAAKNDIPPHTTGCAIDLSYKYMTAEEQNFLMNEIARYEKAGRVEALRENNNCYHIFVFPKGHPPSPASIKRGGG